MDALVNQSAMSVGFAIALLLVSLLALTSRRDRPLPKHRISRVARPGAHSAKPAADLPSIARRQYGFLKRSKSTGEKRSVLAAIVWLDRLLQTGGWPISLPQLGLLVSLVTIVIILLVEPMLGVGHVTTTIIVVPLAGLLTVQILMRRKAAQLGRFQSIFPEALDLIVRSVRAGLPVSESIKMIGTEVADPVGSAFRDVGANLTIGLSLDDALTMLQRKVPIPEVKFFAISLTIQQETGGNLAEILSNLANIMRKRVQIGKKIRALSSEARASALIIGSLPFIVGFAIFFLNRQYIEVLFLEEAGRMFLGAAVGSITLGALVMAKLIRFEI